MHKTRARIGALAVALGVALAFVLCGVVARADENYPFTLTVKATSLADGEDAAKHAALLKDLEGTGAVVDVYKIAEAKKAEDGQDTYVFGPWADGFDEVGKTFDAYQKKSQVLDEDGKHTDITASEWASLYGAAAAVVAKGGTSVEAKTVSLDEAKATFSGMDLGVYLVIAHGDGEKLEEVAGEEGAYAGVATGDYAKFTFPATMVTVPTKAADESGNIYTDGASGEWILDKATITLKSSYEPLFGSLRIKKSVDEYTGEETMFVFHIVDQKTGGDEYDSYAAITFPLQADEGTLVTHIPAGMTVEVSETYAGGRYKAKDAGPKTVTIAKDEEGVDPVSVAFENEPSGDEVDGHGVENHFQRIENGDWPMTQTPDHSKNPTEPATAEQTQ